MVYYLVLLVRLILAPLIFIWPATSVIVSFLLDAVDGDIAASAVSKERYQAIDKTVDFWVYIFEMSYAWINFDEFKLLLLGLFIWRLAGLILFYVTANRRLFIIFGNYFENVFFVIFFGFTKAPFFYFAVAVASLIKFFQEWFIHIADLSVIEDIFKIKRRWKK